MYYKTAVHLVNQNAYVIKTGPEKYCSIKTSHTGIDNMWILKNSKYTPLVKLLARQARPVTTQDGSGNKAENYSSISTANQHQLRQKMYE